MSHTTNLATHIENALQQVLEHDANTRARETGFVQRQRTRTDSTFAQRMVFGAASNPCPNDTDWTQAAARAGTTLTPQGIDQRFTPEAAHLLYALLQRLGVLLSGRAARQAGVGAVRRYKRRTEVLTLAGEPLDLLAWLSQVGTEGERWVLLDKQARVPVRWIASRLSEASVNRARRRLYAYAGKKDGKPSQRALALAGWVVLITNVPEELLSARAVWVLARVRWQVEILFRVWTSCFRVDECRRRRVWRVLCALYAKLMSVVVWHWLVLVCGAYGIGVCIRRRVCFSGCW